MLVNFCFLWQTFNKFFFLNSHLFLNAFSLHFKEIIDYEEQNVMKICDLSLRFKMHKFIFEHLFSLIHFYIIEKHISKNKFHSNNSSFDL